MALAVEIRGAAGQGDHPLSTDGQSALRLLGALVQFAALLVEPPQLVAVRAQGGAQRLEFGAYLGLDGASVG